MLEEFPTAKIIFLYRKSVLEQYCSQVIATKTRQFVKKGESSSVVFNLNLADWEKYRESHVQAYRNALNTLRKMSSSYLTVIFEDLIADPADSLNNKLLPDLKLECIDIPPSPLKKQEKRALSEIILNYQETIDHIQPQAEIFQGELEI